MSRANRWQRRPHAGRPWAAARALGLVLLGAVAGLATGAARAAAAPLRVVATVPDLASLAEAVGGQDVSVVALAKGREDPHFVETKPSFIKDLNQADVYVQLGLEMEAGYAPLLLQNARNPRVLPGNPGYIDASQAISPLEVPVVPVDRSMGDVHPLGNPHYLLDPVNGLAVARFIQDRLSQLRPELTDAFRERFERFRARMAAGLVGEALAAKYDAEKLALLAEEGRLQSFLEQQGDGGRLAGWLGRMAPFRGTPVVDDHNMWPYFARRFGLVVVGHMEPKPGIPPTTSHLQNLVELMRARQVRLILAAPYYDPRHARFLADATGARIAYIAHQVGGVDGVDDYYGLIDYNVGTVAGALGGGS